VWIGRMWMRMQVGWTLQVLNLYTLQPVWLHKRLYKCIRGGLIVSDSESFGALDLANSNAITVTETRKFTNILED